MTARCLSLTPAMFRALVVLCWTGSVYAGRNVTPRGSEYRVPASVVEALVRRGFARLALNPEGGMMAVPFARAAVAS